MTLRPLLVTAVVCVAALGWATLAPSVPAAGDEDEDRDAHHYRDVVELTFPTHGDLARPLDASGLGFIDDYAHARGNDCGIHRATDVFGPHGTPVIAARSGEVAFAPREDPAGNAGWMIRVRGDDGNTYDYVHLGRDDGGPDDAYADHIAQGARVERGEQIGVLGSSGNASVDNPHLHFEVRPTDQDGERAEQIAASNEWDCPYYNPHPSLEDAIAREDLVTPGELPEPDDEPDANDDEPDADDDGGPEDDEDADDEDDGRSEDDEDDADDPDAVDRLAGSDREATAAAIARSSWSSSDVAVLTASDAVADALTAGPLAGALDAPLLTTSGDALHEEAAAALRDLDVTQVWLVGGPAVLADAVAEDLRALGLDVERVAGEDRYATAVAVAERVWETADTDRAVLALGDHPDPSRSWPDALTGAWLGAVRGHPVLLAAPDAVPATTLEAAERATIVQPVGGSAVITSDHLHALEGPTRVFAPLAGDERYATSRAVVDDTLRVAGLSPSRAWLATGHDYADALAAGPAAARHGEPLVLARPDARPREDLTGWLAEHGLDRARLVGGDAALPEELEAALPTALRQ